MNELMLLWRCDGKGLKLAQHVAVAAQYYADKHGHAPAVVLANPKELAEALTTTGAVKAGSVTVTSSKRVIKGHLLLGMGQAGT